MLVCVFCDRLHPISGLAISAGMDGVVKVLNLEALTELFCVPVGAGGGSILDLKVVPLSRNQFGCLFSQSGGGGGKRAQGAGQGVAVWCACGRSPALRSSSQ